MSLEMREVYLVFDFSVEMKPDMFQKLINVSSKCYYIYGSSLECSCYCCYHFHTNKQASFFLSGNTHICYITFTVYCVPVENWLEFIPEVVITTTRVHHDDLEPNQRFCYKFHNVEQRRSILDSLASKMHKSYT
jgi:hypothetical protein